MDISMLIIAMGIPSAITGFCFWLLEKKAEKREKEIKERELLREQSQMCILKSVQASLALGEATAKAVQRIPDAQCNGDMHKALAYAESVKHEQKDFLNKQAVKHIY